MSLFGTLPQHVRRGAAIVRLLLEPAIEEIGLVVRQVGREQRELPGRRWLRSQGRSVTVMSSSSPFICMAPSPINATTGRPGSFIFAAKP